MHLTPSFRVTLTVLVALLPLACGDEGRPTGEGVDSLDSLGDEIGTGDDTPETGDDQSTEGPEKFDFGAQEDVPLVDGCGGDGGGGMGEVDFSYIWVANSPESTISKINTMTMVEEGRYLTRPDAVGNPSRTSVSLSGAVAVANRAGGITKVIAESEKCNEMANGVPGLQTSAGAGNVLPWGQDDCLAWYSPMPYDLQRPLAWAPAEVVQTPDGECEYVNEKLWTTGAYSNQGGTVVAIRINGDTGAVEANVPVPEITSIGGLGPYGGAVDQGANFWFTHREGAAPFPLVRVDAVTLAYTIYPVPVEVHPYGITVDSKGRVWIAGTAGGTTRFDPATQTWATLPGLTGLGLQEDGLGRMWVAVYPWDVQRGVYGIDSETATQIDFIDMTPYAPQSRGISIDAEGNVWMVDQTSSAYRIDPETKQWQVYSGLNAPYTYSDMTGWGLKNVTPPSQG
jgi:DNA-binding beta-propeller fold protein YncE